MKIYDVKLTWIYGSDDASKQKRLDRKVILESMGIPDIDPEASSPRIIVDASQLAELQAAGVAVEEVRGYVLERDSMESILARFEAIAKKLDTLPLHDFVHNERCEVHMPGQALSTYNETLLIEDACTDVLQESLNSGWRIICACPQPDSRRPDYILGRFNPQLSVGGTSAKRNPKD